MASGTVFFSFYPNNSETVPDNSCASVLTVAQLHMQKYGTAGWSAISCSADPVKAATVINWKNLNSVSTWSIKSISATPAPVINFSETVSSTLIITCFFVLLYFIGFHTGSQNGNR